VAVERLWSYLDRHLDERKEHELEQHLGLCRHCCGELEFAKQVRAKLAETAEAPLSPEHRARLRRFVREVTL
jgi:anti-sigma factor RsiW